MIGVLAKTIPAPAAALVMGRCAVAALALWLVCRATGRRLPGTPRVRAGVVVAGLLLGGHWLTLFVAYKIAAVGPVTNVGTLLQRHPELADRIERIVVVAGRRPGQKFVTTERSRERPPRDFNFESDVEAMRVLLESDVPLVLAPWEGSSKVWISREDLRRLAGRSEAGAWIARTSQYWVQRWESARDVAFSTHTR